MSKNNKPKLEVVENCVVDNPDETAALEALMREAVEDDPFIRRVATQLETLPAEEYEPIPAELQYNLVTVFPEMEQAIEASKTKSQESSQAITNQTREYTGLSVSYYQVPITSPTTEGRTPYVAECNDIIEALGMSFAEGNVFKAVWRMCAARQGKQKDGYRDALYDAEKIVFFGQRMVAQLREKK